MDSAFCMITVVFGLLLVAQDCAYTKDIQYNGTKGESIELKCPNFQDSNDDDFTLLRGDIMLMTKSADGKITRTNDTRWRGRMAIVNDALQLHNLSTSDSGLYICKFGWFKYNIRLHIADPHSVKESTTSNTPDEAMSTTAASTNTDRILHIVVGVGCGQIGLMTILVCVFVWYKKKTTWGPGGHRSWAAGNRTRAQEGSRPRYSLATSMTGGSATADVKPVSSYVSINYGYQPYESLDRLNEGNENGLRESCTTTCSVEYATSNRSILGVGKSSTAGERGKEILGNENLDASVLAHGNSEEAFGDFLCRGKVSPREYSRAPLSFASGHETTRGYSEAVWTSNVQLDRNNDKGNQNRADTYLPSADSLYTEIEHNNVATLVTRDMPIVHMYDHLQA